MEEGSLGFSVTIYTICALVCIALLMARRYLAVFGKAELGGPNGAKYASAVIILSLWVTYIVLSSLQVTKGGGLWMLLLLFRLAFLISMLPLFDWEFFDVFASIKNSVSNGLCDKLYRFDGIIVSWNWVVNYIWITVCINNTDYRDT